MTSAELDTACRLLYGERWQSALARDIARERETVNRWARGKNPIPKAVERWIGRELKRKELRTKGRDTGGEKGNV